MVTNRGIGSRRARLGLARARGFTLLEMMVVLVIAGLLVSLASVSLTRNPRTDRGSAKGGTQPLDEARERSVPPSAYPLDALLHFVCGLPTFVSMVRNSVPDVAHAWRQ